MSTQSPQPGNGNSPAPSQQPKQTKAQLDVLLQEFDVLPSRVDRVLFQYSYLYLLGLFFLTELLNTIYLLGKNSQVGGTFQGVGLSLLPTLTILAVLWRFHAWRVRAPHSLRDLVEQKRIALPEGDADGSYLRFLEHYRDALVSPKRYLLSAFLMIFISIVFAYNIVQTLLSAGPDPTVALLVVGKLLLVAFYLGGFYCIGILTWTLYISARSVRTLLRAFHLNIQPFHPDRCGGLKLLGNFCLGLGSPLLIASGLSIGYILFALVAYAPSINGNEMSYLVLNVYSLLFLLLVYYLPAVVLVFILPLPTGCATRFDS